MEGRGRVARTLRLLHASIIVLGASVACGEPPARETGRAPFEVAREPSSGAGSETASEPTPMTEPSDPAALGGGVVDSASAPEPSVVAGSESAAADPEVDPEADPVLPRDEAGRFLLPDGSVRPDFERPEAIRGIYLNAWAAGSSRRRAALLALAGTTEINTFVIDIKDATGYVSHRSELEAVQAIGADGEIRIADLPGLLRELEERDIYPIARIVIVKDPLLTAARPELAVQDTAGGVWVDSKEIVWMNAYDRGVWEYVVDLAREVALLGFPEIQWDYVRFPDAPRADLERASFPGDSIGPRTEAIRGLLGYARDELDALGLGVQSTADVFGVTTSVRRDVGIGQVWETFIDRVDAALPMVYPSHYWTGSFGIEEPNGAPYEIVREAIGDAVERSEAVAGAGRVIPWLQDFTLGAPRYEAPEVRAQMVATYDAGVDEWILWNPGSSYTEDALEPVGGWVEEPKIRVGGRIVPESERFEVLTEMERRKAVDDSISGRR